jgi:phenylacetate-CoA ligase
MVAEISSPEIAARQLPLLQQHLAYLQQSSPYYRQLFKQCGFTASEVCSLDDLRQLPLTDKSELSRFNHDFLAAAEEKIVDICQTSGTTGDAVTFWQTEADLQRLAKNEQLAFTAAGIKVTDRVLIGAALDRVFMAGLAYFLGLRRIGATAIRAGSGQPALIAVLILQQHPNVLVGVPSLLLMVAHQLQQRSEEPATWGIEKIICIGEPVRNEDLTLSPLGQALNDKWSAQIFGTYASTEMATAFTDCCNGCGGHLLSELIIVEILDNAGDPVAVGETGEIVVTPLGIEGTPLLRYRTGDIAQLHIDPCACGRETPRLGPILGRRAQMLKCRGTTLFPPAVSAILQQIDNVQGHYLEVFSEYDLSDRLRVVVGCDGNLNAAAVAEQIVAKTRVKPEVVLVSPAEIRKKTLQPKMRKPVTFFDYRDKKGFK